MKLTYRGVQYNEEYQSFFTTIATTKNQEITYRGHSLRGTIKPNFPWLGYLKQLFRKSESRSILDPIAFWYDHKRKFIAQCWSLNDLEKLNLAWNLTIQIEKSQALRSKQQVKLKYRGVTYYK